MSSNKLKYELNDQTLNFDFDEWVALNKEDPEAFERRRIEWSRQLINNASPSCQRRLSGLLFQINMEKRRSANAMDSCIKLSRLMWEKFHQLRDELQVLVSTPPERFCDEQPRLGKQTGAEIVEFRPTATAKQALAKP